MNKKINFVQNIVILSVTAIYVYWCGMVVQLLGEGYELFKRYDKKIKKKPGINVCFNNVLAPGVSREIGQSVCFTI